MNLSASSEKSMATKSFMSEELGFYLALFLDYHEKSKSNARQPAEQREKPCQHDRSGLLVCD
jgi:hypothetical protein